MRKAHTQGLSASQDLAVDCFEIRHGLPVGKVRETVSANDAVDLSLSFLLNTGVGCHVVEEATGRGDGL